MSFDKPHIKFDPLVKMFYCECVKEVPGERCYLVGSGKTPSEAFKEWQQSTEFFERNNGTF